MPDGWGITTTYELKKEIIQSFTEEGLASGVFDGITPADMSNWWNSYHNTFTDWCIGFVPFERGNTSGQDVVTIAAENYKPRRVYIRKADDVNEITDCVVPNDIYHYTIAFHAGPIDETNVVITDYLPEGVDFVSATPDTGIYTPWPEHKYIWSLGDVAGYNPNVPGDPNYYFTLTVQANTHAEPKGMLYNRATAESDFSSNQDTEYTPVCCWGGNIIYVDSRATGANIGTGWADAYTTLQKAILRATKGCGNEIWVAKGTYFPGTQTTDSFVMPAGVNIYGGFAGNETQRDQRNFNIYKTILSGFIIDL